MFFYKKLNVCRSLFGMGYMLARKKYSKEERSKGIGTSLLLPHLLCLPKLLRHIPKRKVA
jgi:hypothetical protein